MFLFYKNRAIRIFSLYWPLVVIVFIFIPGAGESFISGNVFDKFTNIFLLGADWNLDFARYPNDNLNAVPAGLHPAWTLGAEMSFYVLAPLLVHRWRLVLGLFVASLLLRAGLVSHFGTAIVERWTYYFTPSTFLFFMAGQGVCLLARRFAMLKDHRLGGILMLLAFAVMFFTHDTGFDIARLWVSATLFTAALPGFFDATKDRSWMNALGNLSYPIYLTHTLAVQFLGPPLYYACVRLGLATQSYVMPVIATFLLIAVAIGIAAHLLLERPLAALFRAMLSRTSVFFPRLSA
jgi:peptidoglycan/LPS O-acetylase OafA/YrhL